MRNEILPKFIVPILLVIALPLFIMLFSSDSVVLGQSNESSGALTVVDSSGKPKAVCPLKHTSVKAEISGFLSRVSVTQEFENPYKEKIEAVYTFPLPQNAAVDDMTMRIGERSVRGKILPREEAQAVYEAAKANGQVASLLDQERPNIFTQSVANILPGEQIRITISYVETLKYENGSYEFMFPMVVGPRYMPGAPTGAKSGNGAASDTTEVPDASRISPGFTPRGMRSGHDVSLEIQLDAGLLIDEVSSKTHPVDIQQVSPTSARVQLRDAETIPNKDFILRYDVAGRKIGDALLTHRSEKGGFFTLILQPPDRITAEDVTPKELVFVLDTSGSMNGFPIEKAKETMKLAMDNLYPSDTFNLITFAGDTSILFPAPVPATKGNLLKAQAFLESRTGAGGTEMMTAIRAALEASDKQDHVRIVCFMTDGYVGNDMAIISEVQKHPNARVFAFGIGSSVNRFLLDKMAESGRGEVEYVGLNDDGSAAAKRFHERVRNPLLTDIAVDWNGLPVADIYPQRIPDLFGAKPVILTGRFTSAARGTIRLKGKMAGSDFVREVAVDFPETMASHDVLSSLWARQRIDNLMGQDYSGAQQGTMKPDLKQTITQIGLEYRLMTQFTSFVAVEEMIVTDGGQPRRIDVPVEVPEGVNREMVERVDQTGLISYGASSGYTVAIPKNMSSLPIARPAKSKGRAGGGGSGGGVGSGSGANAKPLATLTPGVVNSRVAIDAAEELAVVDSPADRKRAELQAKLHPSVLALLDRLKSKSILTGPDEAKFVSDGKAEVQVWLSDKSNATVEKLKQLGFEVVLDPKTSKLIIGRIALDKLEALTQLEFVKYISPQARR